MRLETPLNFSRAIDRAAIDGLKLSGGLPVIITGWGSSIVEGTISNYLKYNYVNTLNETQCILKTHIYTGGVLCIGHSGGNGICSVSS
jgi:hypothetical protein